MSHRAKNEKGFTLVEVLLVMLILSIILVTLVQVVNTNFKTMNDEFQHHEEKENLQVFSSYLFQDLIYAKTIDIRNESAFDVLVYQDRHGNEQKIKFVYDYGIYEIVGEQDVLIAQAAPFDATKPMVYEANGLVYVNAYAKDMNVLVDLAIQPRSKEGSK